MITLGKLTLEQDTTLERIMKERLVDNTDLSSTWRAWVCHEPNPLWARRVDCRWAR